MSDWKPEWQPIETAPKDGTAILVYSPGVPFDEPTNIIVAQRDSFLGNSWWGYCEGLLSDASGEIDPEPTHWMPLPLPPAGEP